MHGHRRFLSTVTSIVFGLVACLLEIPHIVEARNNIFRSATDDAVEQLQTWLNNKVSKSNTMISVSGAVVAAFATTKDSSVHSVHVRTVVAGHSVLDRAVDETTGTVITSPTGESVDATASTTYMLASVSKVFVWTALSMMLDDGAFDLDDDVGDVLSFEVRNPQHSGTKVTYRHLYAHTSGIEDDYDTYLYGDECPTDPLRPYPTDLESSLRSHVGKRSNWASFAPGSKYKYSNFATALAALLVEKHSGMSFAEFTTTFIFEPLGMDSTQWTRPTDGSAAELYEQRKASRLLINDDYDDIDDNDDYDNGNDDYDNGNDDYDNGNDDNGNDDYDNGNDDNDDDDDDYYYYYYDDYDDSGKGNDRYITWRGAYCYNDWPSGQLWSTAEDVAKFAWAMLQKGNLGNGSCLYGPETGTLVFRPISPGTGDGDSALGWFVGPPHYAGGAGHNGGESGVSSDLFVGLATNTKVAVVWLANGALTDTEYEQLTKEFVKTAKKIGSVSSVKTSSSCARTYNARVGIYNLLGGGSFNNSLTL